MAKPRCLDLFCGAGGASMGLHRAGYEVVGVDIEPQPRYPFEFHCADATTYPLEGFDFIWASPPCQKYTSMKSMPKHRDDHPDLVAPTRVRLKAAGVPYTIENVYGAPLARGSLMLCGTMFGLGTADGSGELRRHRWFECSFGVLSPGECRHNAPTTISPIGRGEGPNQRERFKRAVNVWGHAGGSSKRDGIKQFSTAEWREAMGIDWMTGAELAEAIPPAYSEYVGRASLR